MIVKKKIDKMRNKVDKIKSEVENSELFLVSEVDFSKMYAIRSNVLIYLDPAVQLNSQPSQNFSQIPNILKEKLSK
jgi:hypothetical protein